MAGKISRRTLARHAATRLAEGDKAVVPQLAAYLVETGRTSELDLIVRDIEDVLKEEGIVVAEVASARQLTDATVRAISSYLQHKYSADEVQLRQRVDPSLMGGIQVRTADAELDTTIRRKLTTLKKAKL